MDEVTSGITDASSKDAGGGGGGSLGRLYAAKVSYEWEREYMDADQICHQ